MYNTKNSGVLSPFSLARLTDYNIQLHLVPGNMAVRTTGAGGAQAPLTSKAGGLSPPKNEL